MAQGSAAKRKISRVLKEYKTGTLHSGSSSGPVVKDKAQALAIAMSEARKKRKRNRAMSAAGY